jgi:hypothetical protein
MDSLLQMMSVNVVPFLLSLIFIKHRVVIAKSHIFRRLWYRQLFDCVGQLSVQMGDLDISVCLDLKVIPVVC